MTYFTCNDRIRSRRDWCLSRLQKRNCHQCVRLVSSHASRKAYKHSMYSRVPCVVVERTDDPLPLEEEWSPPPGPMFVTKTFDIERTRKRTLSFPRMTSQSPPIVTHIRDAVRQAYLQLRRGEARSESLKFGVFTFRKFIVVRLEVRGGGLLLMLMH